MSSQFPPSSAPWPLDSTKNATLANLKAAYSGPLTTDSAYALVRGQPGFVPGTVPLVDNETDLLAYVRFWWPTM